MGPQQCCTKTKTNLFLHSQGAKQEILYATIRQVTSTHQCCKKDYIPNCLVATVGCTQYACICYLQEYIFLTCQCFSKTLKLLSR